MKTSTWLLCTALAVAGAGCRNDDSGGAMGTGDRAGKAAGDLDRDRGGNAQRNSGQVSAPNPGAPSAAGATNTGTRDQQTSGVTVTPSGSSGSTPKGAASNTLGSDRDVNQRGALGTGGNTAAQPSNSNVPNRPPPSGAQPATTSPKGGAGGM